MCPGILIASGETLETSLGSGWGQEDGGSMFAARKQLVQEMHAA